MDSKKYAYVDEFGAFGFNFTDEGCSTHFITCAIIVDEKNLDTVLQGVETVRQRYFQKGEIKSNKVGDNHKRRLIILSALKNLPFHIFVFVCDKRKIYENSGLRNKQSYYKFLNNIAYQELRTSFARLVICADEVGGNDYIKSFAAYVRSKEQPLTFFDESDFRFIDSKKSVLIQLADMVCGSLAYSFDEHKKAKAQNYNYLSFWGRKILRIKQFPETIENFIVEVDPFNNEFNLQIAETCYRRAKKFVENNRKSDNLETKQQLAVLNYLLFRFMNRSPRKYIPTAELQNQLEYLGFERMSTQAFRNKIIAKLRDSEVIISSSSKGYKIPSTEQELFDFVNHGKSIIMPMLSRLKICNDVIRIGTDGAINLFERAEYCDLSKMLDAKNN